MAQKKILAIGMANSIHVARWLSQIADQGWDIHLFPSVDYGYVHPELKHVTVYHSIYGTHKAPPDVNLKGIYVPPLPLLRSLETLGRTKLNTTLHYRAKQLKRVIQKLKPDLIHIIEFQHAGYLFLEAYQSLSGQLPPVLITNWGNDIYLFGRLSAHRDKVTALVQLADYYSCECERDIRLAKELGMTAEAWPVMPNTGGLDLQKTAQLRQPGPTSARKWILLKGYQNWAGRALFGLRAIELCARELQGYHIAIYSAPEDVAIAAELVSQNIGVPIEIIPRVSHDELLKKFGSARIYMGLNISDGVSTSMLEALVMGAFPIQANTACADEWLKHGETGMIVHPENVDEIAAALRRALTDDALVDHAAAENARVAAERLDYSIIKTQVVDLYRNILNAGEAQ